MTAGALVDQLFRRGVRLRSDGDRLRWSAPAGTMTRADVAALRQHKAEALGIVRDVEHDAFEERAAIREFDGGMTRTEAEAAARLERGTAA